MRRFLLALAFLATCAAAAYADSLYTSASFFDGIFSDPKAAKVGDVLHIIIAESASATQGAVSTHNKEADASAGAGTGWLDFLPLIGYGGKSEHAAKDSATRSGSLTARLTVTVKEVLAGGNLLVEGRRHVRINKDVQDIIVRGEVCPRDISRTNTILSHQVANVEIDYVGSDPNKPGAKVGIFQRVINLFF